MELIDIPQIDPKITPEKPENLEDYADFEEEKQKV